MQPLRPGPIHTSRPWYFGDGAWEHATGGSENRKYPWGAEEPGARVCWDREGNDLGKGKRKSTCPVGSHPGADSRFGLHDRAGNRWQWTSIDHGNQGEKLFRGGSWDNSDPTYLKTRFGPSLATHSWNSVGVRCAQSAPALR